MASPRTYPRPPAATLFIALASVHRDLCGVVPPWADMRVLWRECLEFVRQHG